MSEITIQQYADILSRSHTLFYDGDCTAASHHTRIRLALAARKTGALGVLLMADKKRDVWLMASGLKAKVRGDRITLTGPAGLTLKLSVTEKTATGSLEASVSNKAQTKKRSVSFPVDLKRLSGRPGRPSTDG
jgi:hypothetical protein